MPSVRDMSIHGSGYLGQADPAISAHGQEVDWHITLDQLLGDSLKHKLHHLLRKRCFENTKFQVSEMARKP